MKILHCISSVDPRNGGPIEGITQLQGVNRAEGHEVEVVSLDPPDAPWVAECPFPVHAMGPHVSRYAYSPRLLPWLRANAGRFDAVIVNGLWQYHGLATHRALAGGRVPYFVFTHGMLDPYFKRRYPLKHLRKWAYWPWSEYRLLRDARAVFFTSEQERLEARKSFWLYRCNEVVVNYGTAGPSGDAIAQREAFLERFPALRGRRLLLFLSRIHPKKGCDLLVEAFARVAHRDASLTLVMAGPDQTGWRAELERVAARAGVADRVVWPGMLKGDLKWGAYAAADAFVLPSHQENFGIVVAEALACRVPVLISDKINIWREIDADGAGFVGSDDAAGTLSVLERWLALPVADAERMRDRARACFEARFEARRAAASLVEAMDRLRGARA